MQKLLLLVLFIGSHHAIQAQKNLKFSLSGTVKDADTGLPVEDAKLGVVNYEVISRTDSSGMFKIDGLASNRLQLIIEKNGFEKLYSDLIVIERNSTNYVSISLKPSSTALSEVSVTASRFDASKPVNDLAYVSTRSFSSNDTERIPASVNDPGRMALSFPGVQVGRDENENKIIIRGNSPQGVLWRVEGIDVPNPNHFARPGASGGGLSIFSAQLIDKSDFSIGGMSAEYGNAIAGAFDIRFREGNMSKHTRYFRAGILGLDLSAEGPLKTGKSSYLINYRYSTLGLMNWINVFLVGERAVNTFQDLSVNLVFYGKKPGVRTSLFAVGGSSGETIMPVKNPEDRDINDPEHWEERIRNSKTGIIGLTHHRKLTKKSCLKMVLAGTGYSILRRSDTLSFQDIRFRYNTEDFIDKRVTTSVTYENKFNQKLSFKTGFIGHLIDYRFLKEVYPRGNYDAAQLSQLKNVFADGSAVTQTAQGFVNLEYALDSKTKVQGGLHYMHFFFNGSKSLEPRFAVSRKLKKGHSLAFSAGKYSQLLPLSTYFVVRKNPETKEYFYLNQDAAFPQSNHFIGRYQWISKNHLKVAAEAYLQNIKRVLVSPEGGYFWMLNYADGYADGEVVAEGTGRNYGLDVMVEKFFSKNFYFLATASIFDAKYKTLEAQSYNSGFNDGFGTSLTFGREFKTRKAIWQAGFRSMWNGGFRYSPLDEVTSAELGFFNPILTEVNSLQAPNFFRIDSRIACKFKMGKKTAHVSLDVQNVTANNNYSRVFYNRTANSIELQRKGVGLVPILAFGVGG